MPSSKRQRVGLRSAARRRMGDRDDPWASGRWKGTAIERLPDAAQLGDTGECRGPQRGKRVRT
jgi:hypothetical protein